MIARVVVEMVPCCMLLIRQSMLDEYYSLKVATSFEGQAQESRLAFYKHRMAPNRED